MKKLQSVYSAKISKFTNCFTAATTVPHACALCVKRKKRLNWLDLATFFSTTVNLVTTFSLFENWINFAENLVRETNYSTIETFENRGSTVLLCFIWVYFSWLHTWFNLITQIIDVSYYLNDIFLYIYFITIHVSKFKCSVYYKFTHDKTCVSLFS